MRDGYEQSCTSAGSRRAAAKFFSKGQHELADRNRKLGSQATAKQQFCWVLVGVRQWHGSVVGHRDMWINLTLLRFFSRAFTVCADRLA